MKKLTLLLSLILILALAGCSGAAVTNQAASTGTLVDQGAQTTANLSTAATPVASVAEALAENKSSHEDAKDLTWDENSVIDIALNENSIEATGPGLTVAGSTLTITAAGTYRLSGTLNDGQILVNTEDPETVQLILAGVDLKNSSTSPIFVQSADEVVLYLLDGTLNTVSDGQNYVFASPETNEPNAAIFSLADLTIAGGGSLTVTGNYNDGISSKDGLVISGSTLDVTAADDGIRGKDYLVVEAGQITVQAQGDGLVSDNEEDATRGYISIEAGTFEITAAGDAIQAATDVLITEGDFNLTTGGGSNNRASDATSAKGIKGVVSVNIDGGSFVIQSADDAIHSNNSITINAGSFNLASGDDGIHADTLITINNGMIDITESYEGIESATILLNGGEIHVVSSDDGINIAGGMDGSGFLSAGQLGTPGRDQGMNGSAGKLLEMNGGMLVVDANGDGLDINGSIEMTGGVVLVNGPVENMNAALDYDGDFNISGGFFVAAGSAGMAMAPGQASSQNSILVNLDTALQAGTLFQIQNSAGQDILTFAPTKQYQSVVFSSPDLVQGTTYSIFTGGSTTGTIVDSLVQGGTYSGGTQLTSLTLNSVVTQVGQAGGFGGGRPGGGTRPRP